MAINEDYGPTLFHNTAGNPGVYCKFPSASLDYF
jgi:hypothetical protein